MISNVYPFSKNSVNTDLVAGMWSACCKHTASIPRIWLAIWSTCAEHVQSIANQLAFYKLLWFLNILYTVPAPLKAAATIQKIFFKPLHHNALQRTVFLFSIHTWTKLRKTYQIDAVLIGAGTIQEWSWRSYSIWWSCMCSVLWHFSFKSIWAYHNVETISQRKYSKRYINKQSEIKCANEKRGKHKPLGYMIWNFDFSVLLWALFI